MPKPSVFISCTREDLAPFIAIAKEAALHAGLAPEMQEYFPAEGRRSLAACLDKVAAADVLLVIVAHRYGWVPADQGGEGERSITWLECEHAGSLGKEVLAFIVDDAATWPAELRDSYRLSEAAEQGTLTSDLQAEVQRDIRGLKAFKAWLDTRITARFNSREDLVSRLGPALTGARDRLHRTGGSAETPPCVPREPAAIPDAYMRWLIRECQDIELLGLDQNEQQPTMLRSVYVPLVTSAARERDASAEAPETIRRQDEAPTRVLDLLNERSLYLAGDAGTGKSTFCRWVTWLACTAGMPDHPVPVPEEFLESPPTDLRGRLPVWVRLRDFWSGLPLAHGVRQMGPDGLIQGLAAYLADYPSEPLPRDTLESHLRQGTVLMLLDGVDEVPVRAGDGDTATYPRACLLAALTAALPGWHEAGNRLLLTSRPYAVERADLRRLGLSETLIAGLPPALRELFVRRWFTTVGTPAKADDLLAEVGSREDIAELLEAPVLLTALCVVYGEGGRLPDEKYDLYSKVVNRVLFNRYDDRVEVEKVRARLSVIAHAMHTGQWLDGNRVTPQFGISTMDLDRVLQRYRDENPAVEQSVRNALTARTDLLTTSGLLTARDRGAGFYHPSFQEFLAGDWLLYLASEPGNNLPTIFRRHGNTPEWRNTLGFLFGALIHEFSRNAKRAIALLRELVDAVDPAAVADSHPLAVLVADCVEMIERKSSALDPDVIVRFREVCLAGIGHADGVPVRARQSLGLALGRLGDERIHDARDPAGYIEVPAGDYPYQDGEVSALTSPFLLGRYPVTNGQFRAFMTDGGYEPGRPWWSEEGRAWLAYNSISEPRYWTHPRFNAPGQPVVGVCWFEAQAFCAWAGGRLPTEREWEAAARGPSGRFYPWCDDSTWEDGICNSKESGLGGPSVVGVFPRARQADFGFEDMAGNVWEWSSDRNNDGWPFLRGGSWFYDARYVRAVIRDYFLPVNRYSLVGFRVLLSTRQD